MNRQRSRHPHYVNALAVCLAALVSMVAIAASVVICSQGHAADYKDPTEFATQPTEYINPSGGVAIRYNGEFYVITKDYWAVMTT